MSIDWEQVITWDAGADILSESDYAAINAKAGDYVDASHWATLRARHLLYEGNYHFHNGMYAPDYTDCSGQGIQLGGTGTELTTLGNIQKGTKFAGLGLSAGTTISGIAGGGAFLAPLSILGPIGLGIGLVLAPLAFIAAHHAKAVALEQRDICGMIRAGNAHLDDIDYNFYNDIITESQAGQALDNLRAGLMQIVQPVYEGPPKCNAACHIMLNYDGLVIMRKQYLYPHHTASKILPPVLTQGISGIGKPISDVISTISGGAINLSSGVGFLVVLLMVILAIGIKNIRKAVPA